MPQYATNKKARFDYEILETLEAGLVLTGAEVKSTRNKQIKLTGSFVTFHDSGAYLLNTHISKYKYASIEGYDPERSRKILLNKKQIAYLTEKMHEKGLTIIPLSVYTKKRKIKVEIGICRGKKQFDKKRVLKKRQENRDIKRALKGDY
ncbi:MAG: SsrA-binding protein SmpB [Candidatus Magasanikbacteria bacterium]